MKILVTGGAGFIGSSLVDKLLQRGHSVMVVDNFNDYYSPEIKEANLVSHHNDPLFSLVRANIEDEHAMAGIFNDTTFDLVVHLAARAGVRPSIDKPTDYMKTNVIGTAVILGEMARHGIKKLIFASSSSVYGNCSAESFSEDLKVTEPISPYAASKSACEQLCYTFHHLYGIQTVCLRFFTVYGPRQRPDLAIHKFVDLIEAGKPIMMFGDGSTKRDYTFIDDIVHGILAAIDYDKTGYEIINLGGGEPITLRRMISTIEVALGKKAIVKTLPMQPGDVTKTVCDWSKANRLLGYTPETKFEDGVRKFITWRSK